MSVSSAARPRRPRWRAYLLLARVSNLPTVWTNVLAGMAAQVNPPPAWPLIEIAAAASLFYTGGMFLNDSFDLEFDRRARPERPLPSADLTRTEGFAAGGFFLAAGAALLARDGRTFALGLLLAAAILVYNRWHKRNPAAPLVMGACRGLVYCLAAAALGGPSGAALAGAAVIAAYVVGLTIVARLSGPSAPMRVPVLLAGISLVDAAFIWVITGSWPLVAVAVCGFPLTLAFQKVVPGD